jgi:hypothetical protein
VTKTYNLTFEYANHKGSAQAFVLKNIDENELYEKLRLISQRDTLRPWISLSEDVHINLNHVAIVIVRENKTAEMEE